MSKQTHESRLLDYFEKYRSITSLQSIQDLGNTRLAATVCDMRKKGHTIDSQFISVPNRFGGKTSVSKYTWSKPVPAYKPLW